MGLIKDIRDIEQLSLKEQLQSYDIVLFRYEGGYGLTPCMFIKNRKNIMSFVMLGYAPYGREYVSISDYNDNLESVIGRDGDIIKIYRLKSKDPKKINDIKGMLMNVTNMQDLYLQGDYELIWER